MKILNMNKKNNQSKIEKICENINQTNIYNNNTYQ